MANLETVSDASVANQSYAATENWAEAPKTNNLSDLAQELMSSHAHRPGLVQEDLAKATEALHANGTLANLSIIGLDGKDLIARDDQGHTLLLDASNPENQQVLPTDLVSQPIGESGRTAELAADGSGKYTVVSGDSCWRIANDILTSQGVEQPTDNQIANYIKELETSNGRSFAQLQVGDEINIPTKIQGGESSRFAVPEKAVPPETTVPADTAVPTETSVPAETAIPAESTIPAETVPTETAVPAETSIPADTSVPELSAEAAKQMELEKFGIDTSYALMGQGFERATEHFTPRGTYSKPSATLYDINSTLNRSDLTNNEKLGLQMMQSQYDFLKSSEDGNIHLSDLDRGKALRYQEIEAKYSPSAAEANPAVNPVFNPYAGIFPEVTVTAPTPAAIPY